MGPQGERRGVQKSAPLSTIREIRVARALLNWIYRERRERLAVLRSFSRGMPQRRRHIGRRAKGHAIIRGEGTTELESRTRFCVRLTVSCSRAVRGTNEVRNELDNGPAISSQRYPCNDPPIRLRQIEFSIDIAPELGKFLTSGRSRVRGDLIASITMRRNFRGSFLFRAAFK